MASATADVMQVWSHKTYCTNTQAVAPNRLLLKDELNEMEANISREWVALKSNPAVFKAWRSLAKENANMKLQRTSIQTAQKPFNGLWCQSTSPSDVVPPASLVQHARESREGQDDYHKTFEDKFTVRMGDIPQRVSSVPDTWGRKLLGCCSASGICIEHSIGHDAQLTIFLV